MTFTVTSFPGSTTGPLDLGDSLAMAAQAQADGIDAVCATPHIRHDHGTQIAELDQRVAALNQALEQEGTAVEVLCGGEVAETSLPELDESELRTVALGEGRWVLLEPAPGPLSDSLGRP